MIDRSGWWLFFWWLLLRKMKFERCLIVTSSRRVIKGVEVPLFVAIGSNKNRTSSSFALVTLSLVRDPGIALREEVACHAQINLARKLSVPRMIYIATP